MSASSINPTKTWHDSKRIKKRTKFLFDHCDIVPTDVTFRVGPSGFTEDISAHRLILALGSSVFYAMFFGELREKNEVIRVPDIEPEAFRIMIRYLYSEDITPITMENAMENIYCAKKYIVRNLLKQFRIFVQNNLTPKNACWIYAQATRINEERLGLLALTLISHQMTAALSSDDFLHSPAAMVRALLNRNDLSGTENEIYEAVRRWVVNRTGPNRMFQDSFADVIDCIRLPNMSPSEIALGPAKDGAVSDAEIKEIYIHKYSSVKPPIRFSTELRCPQPDRFYGMLRLSVEDPSGELIISGTVTIQLSTEVAPHCCKLFGDLSSSSRFFVSYGDCLFFSPPHGPGRYTSLPVENQLLSQAPFWVAMVSAMSPTDAEPTPCIKELHIGHESKKFGEGIGTVFARVVDGFDLLQRMEAVNRGLLAGWEESLKQFPASGTQAGVGISFTVAVQPTMTTQEYNQYVHDWSQINKELAVVIQ